MGGWLTKTKGITLEATQADLADVERELADWQHRRADVAERHAALSARSAGLAAQAAEAVLDGTDPKAVRKERTGVLAELEELDLALEMARKRVAELEAALAKAGRRVVVAAAIARLDALTAIAAGLDEACEPMRRQVESVMLAHGEAAAQLHKLFPAHRFTILADDIVLQLLRPLRELFTGPLRGEIFAAARLPRPVTDMLSYATVRAKLEAELLAGDEA
jgi:hypothetical protein